MSVGDGGSDSEHLTSVACLRNTIRSQVSVPKTWMLQLVPGNLGMLSQHLTCLRLGPHTSVQRHEQPDVAVGCREGFPAASGTPAGKTAVACGG